LEERAKRKLSAILSADVKGYSRLMGEDELATVKTLETYREIIAEVIRNYGGRVVDSPGDNVLAEFASVVDAVESAVEIQKEVKVKNEELPTDRRMEFRIGINLGDVIEQGERIYGDGVNVAARLEGIAEPGGVCISGTAFDHIGKKLPFGYEYLGEQKVKNIDKAVRVYRVLIDPGAAGKVIGERKPRKRLWKWAGATALLILIIGGTLAYLSFFKPPSVEPASLEKLAFPLPEEPSIAILPFHNLSGDPNQDYFSDGLTEEIITALSKVPQLFVIARNSTFSYKGKPVKIKQVAEEFGVRYVLEGSVRTSEDRVRITAQLVDAINGRYLWSERYDRELKNIFAIQDEITIKIITALRVKLTTGDEARLTEKGTKNLQSHLKFLQARELFFTQTKETNAQSRRLVEEIIDQDPGFPAAYALLGATHWMEVVYGSSKSSEESLKHAFELTQKAIALDDTHATAHSLLGWLYILIKRDYNMGIAECERAIELAYNSASSHIWMGFVLTLAGRHEEAVRHSEQALRLNPRPEGWFYRFLGYTYFGVGNYEEAITAYKKALGLTPNDILAHTALTTAYSWAGHLEDAKTQAAEVLRINPKFIIKDRAKTLQFKKKEDLERYLEGLRKAGLPETPPLPLPDKPSIAVLPFVNMSGDPEQEYFSDGITEEIITALSKTPKMFVIARTSSFKYKGKEVDVRTIGRELGVRHVLEGGVRKASDNVRVTAQLVDSKTGNQLWAERYERELKDIFSIQDDITMKIVTALRVQLTEGERARVQARYTNNLQAFLKVLEGSGYNRKAKFAEGMKHFQEALKLDPLNPVAYGFLAWTHLTNVWFGPSETRARSLQKDFDMAEKCKALDNELDIGHRILGHAYLLKREYDKALLEGMRAVELNPNSSASASFFGWTLRSVGRYEEAIREYERAIRLSPLSTRFPLTQVGTTYVMMGRYEEGIVTSRKAVELLKTNLPAFITLAIAYSSLDRLDEARSSASEVLELSPNFSVEHWRKALPYKDQVLKEHFVSALHKAGLK
jgi:adenylate cyclase